MFVVTLFVLNVRILQRSSLPPTTRTYFVHRLGQQKTPGARTRARINDHIARFDQMLVGTFASQRSRLVLETK